MKTIPTMGAILATRNHDFLGVKMKTIIIIIIISAAEPG
jgi:hypothetical protein